MMKVCNIFLFCLHVLILAVKYEFSTASSVSIQNNAYSGIVVAINPNVTEDPDLLQKIQVGHSTSDLEIRIQRQHYVSCSRANNALSANCSGTFFVDADRKSK